MVDETRMDEVAMPRRSGFPFAGLLVVIPLVAVFFYGVAGEDKYLLLSPLIIAGYVLLLVWMLRAAISRQTVTVAPPAFYPLLAFVVFGVVLSFFCPIAYEAKVRMLMVGFCAGAYYIAGNSFVLFRNNRTVLGWLMLFALLMSFYGLINFFKQPEMVLWSERYTSTYKDLTRLASTYICPNHFAHLLQMLLPFCLILIFIPRAGIPLRIMAGYCMLVYLPTMYFTESRAGMLGSIAALGVTILLLALRRSRKLFLLLVLIVPLFSTLLLWGGWRYSEMFKRRMTPVVEFLVDAKDNGFAHTNTRDFRPLTWLDSLDMVKEKPVTGFGPGSYRYTFPEYRKRFKGKRLVSGHPHNEYLEIAAEYGWVGFALFAFAWCWGLLRLLVFSLKTPNQHHAFMAMAFIGTASGTMLHSFFDFQMHVFQNALLFSLLAGIAAGPMCGRRQEQWMKGEGGAPRMVPRLIRICLVIAIACASVIAIQTFSSSMFRAMADRLAEKGLPEKAKQYYRTAIRIDSSNWRAYKGLGKQLHKDRYYCLDMEEKRTLAMVERETQEKGYEHNPKDAQLVLDLGETLFFLGDIDAGIALMKQAAVMRPFNDTYWWSLGVAERKAGRLEEALDTFTYAARVNNSPSTRKNIQWIKKQLSAAENAVSETEATDGLDDSLPQKTLQQLMEEF